MVVAPAAGAVRCMPGSAHLRVCLRAGMGFARDANSAADKVSVYQASTALQDPHRIEAKPSLVARMRNADLAVCTGAELEIGWLPVLLQTAGNKQVQPGLPGFFEAAGFVRSWTCRRPSTARPVTCIRRQSAHPPGSAQRGDGRNGAGRAPRDDRCRATRLATEPALRISSAAGSRDRALGRRAPGCVA